MRSPSIPAERHGPPTTCRADRALRLRSRCRRRTCADSTCPKDRRRELHTVRAARCRKSLRRTDWGQAASICRLADVATFCIADKPGCEKINVVASSKPVPEIATSTVAPCFPPLGKTLDNWAPTIGLSARAGAVKMHSIPATMHATPQNRPTSVCGAGYNIMSNPWGREVVNVKAIDRPSWRTWLCTKRRN